MSESVNCAWAMEVLQDYLKRELTPEQACDLKAHLERCRPCFAHLRFEENFLRLLEERCGRQGCPEALRNKVLQALRQERTGEGH